LSLGRTQLHGLLLRRHLANIGIVTVPHLLLLLWWGSENLERINIASVIDVLNENILI